MYSDPRDAVFEEIYQIAEKNPEVILLTVDTGARKFKEFAKNLPGQFFNVGISEQNAISVAGGLASTGKKVYIFGIGTFVTLRCLEQIKIDICSMNFPVCIVGMSTGYGYASDGPTHHVIEDVALMRCLPNMKIWSPSDCSCLANAVQQSYKDNSPSYLRFDKQLFTPIYPEFYCFSDTGGIDCVLGGKDIAIVATSAMVSKAIEVAKSFKAKSVGVIDISLIKPLNEDRLSEMISKYDKIITLEEHNIYGGIGSVVSEVVSKYNLNITVKILGIQDRYSSEVGSREYLCSLDNIDNKSIRKVISDWVGE